MEINLEVKLFVFLVIFTTFCRTVPTTASKLSICHVPGVDILDSRIAVSKKPRSKRFHGPCLYYAKSIALQQIELLCSGDIQLNPGPKSSRKCPTCDKTIRKNQKDVECTACFEGYHLKCISKFQGNREMRSIFKLFSASNVYGLSFRF